MNEYCKYMRAEPYHTPNNYDINFDYNTIAANIEIHNVSDVDQSLTKATPLTKTIHLHLNKEEKEIGSTLHLDTLITAEQKNNNETTLYQVKII